MIIDNDSIPIFDFIEKSSILLEEKQNCPIKSARIFHAFIFLIKSHLFWMFCAHKYTINLLSVAKLLHRNSIKNRKSKSIYSLCMQMIWDYFWTVNIQLVACIPFDEFRYHVVCGASNGWKSPFHVLITKRWL